MSIEYNLQGDKNNPYVLFLHGWGGDLKSFSYFAKALSEQGYCTINTALSGHGASPPPDGEWGIADYCYKVLKLLDKLGVTRVSIVGHSFGGRAAIYLAAHHPELVGQLVLISSAGIIPKRGLRYKYRVWRYKRAKRKGHNTAKYGSSDYLNISDDNIRKSFVKIVNEDLEPLLCRITASAHIIWGDKDKDTPMYMARRLNKGISNSTITLLKGGDHWGYAKQPQATISILKEILAR